MFPEGKYFGDEVQSATRVNKTGVKYRKIGVGILYV